ncbi:L,D-transpeptidase [Phormidium sp. CLA17]|uniref:L,D-transpeptidase n=1 Tax=Leptolyngbya sp. Cla-17 TaxID=2803751 RepID=UPI0014926802|nr:L,D-transpeptidase [Leptolyngbya sp. Cla-17]MBM0740925.1 L,D-transpeptidase [Leptolyngbya sp. Cla-17]
MHRLSKFIGDIATIGIVGLVSLPQVTFAALPPVQSGDAIALPNSPFDAPSTIPPRDLEPELPPTNPELKPLYIQEPFQKPNQDQPLRLEIKLSLRRVTLYRGSAVVKSYPIAVGRAGWETPKGTFQVKQMFRDPAWIHPLKKGIVIPGGDPENPLGRYWIGFWSNGKNWIGFHGTDNPKSVGTAASHGCIRMYNKDIEELFKKVNLGIEVKVVK